MGIGTFPANGEIELYVSIQESPDTQTLNRWKASFEEASKMLFHATHGQARFAIIHLSTNGEGDADPDATVSIDQPSSYALGHPTVVLEDGAVGEGFGEETVMSIGADGYQYPFVILHEFGHYGFELGDEYRDISTNLPIRCSQNQRLTGGPLSRGNLKKDRACIMGVPALHENVTQFSSSSGVQITSGWIEEFCHGGNHDTNADSNQNFWHDESCAEVILTRRKITVPQQLKPKDGYVSIKWEPTTSGMELGYGGDFAQVPGFDVDPSDPPDWAVDAAEIAPLFASPKDRVSLISFGKSNAHNGLNWTLSVNDALERMRRQLGGTGPRAAEVALVFFSTGLEPIRDGGGLAKSFAQNGARLFTIGTGRDRTALQQLAQGTGGAYYEVDPANGRTPLQNTQLVRSHVARSFDRLRFGAPVTLVSRDELDNGTATFWVGNDSESLKLVLTKALSPSVEVSLKDGRGATVNTTWTQSTRGGFQFTTVDKPRPGRWTVELPANAPDALDLAVYSKNPKVRLGVTGWRRPRRVGDTVRLKVVVRAPLAVVDLALAGARVRPPGRGSRSTWIDFKAHRDGVHLAEFKVSEPGAYEVDVKVRNDGNAVAAGLKGDPSAKTIPGFERARRVQVHVAN